MIEQKTIVTCDECGKPIKYDAFAQTVKYYNVSFGIGYRHEQFHIECLTIDMIGRWLQGRSFATITEQTA